MRNWVGSLSVKKRVMLGVLLLFLVVSLALIVNNWLSSPDSEVTRIKDIAGTVQSSGHSLCIVVVRAPCLLQITSIDSLVKTRLEEVPRILHI